MRLRAFFFLSLVCVALPGCAYRLGPTNGEHAGTRSVQIRPFENKTVVPQLSEPITHALRREMLRDGTYRVDTSGDCDILVSGTIVNYDRRTIALQPKDALSPRDYRLVITAQVIARERVTGKVLLDRKVQGYSDIRIGSDEASAEREAMPLVAEDLARNATALIVDGTW
jgi:hypothetical protein